MKQKYKWEQQGDKVCLLTNEGLTWWKLPIKLEEIHPDLLFVVECLLSFPFYNGETRNRMAEYEFTRKQGKYPALCFSGGVDSLASKLLMPDNTRLVYHNRDIEGINNHHFKNIKPLFDKMDNLYTISSNSDAFRMKHGKCCGFSTDYCCGLGLILMADYLDLGYFATGTILESAYLSGSGVKYWNLTERKNHSIWVDLFKDIGLEFYLPVASISETITSKIVRENGMTNLAISCYNGNNCGECIKCYRKALLNNKPIKITQGIQEILDEKPIHFYATYTKYSIDNKLKWDRYTDGDFSWIDEYYPPAFTFIPDKFKKFNKEQIEKYAKPMKQPYLIEQIDITNNKYPKIQ